MFYGGPLLSGPLENVLGREGCSNNLWTHFNAAATFDACSKSHKENPIYSKAETNKYFIAQGLKTLKRGRLQNILQGSILPKPTQFIVFVDFTILLSTWFRAILAVGCVTKLAQRGTVPNCANGISSQVRPLYWHFYINRTSDIKSLALIFYIEKSFPRSMYL